MIDGEEFVRRYPWFARALADLALGAIEEDARCQSNRPPANTFANHEPSADFVPLAAKMAAKNARRPRRKASPESD